MSLLLFLVGCTITPPIEIETEDPKFTITWLNDDDSVILTSQVKKGDFPEYTENEPIKPNDSEGRWVFISWEPAINFATEDSSYKAYYIDSINYEISSKYFEYQIVGNEVTITGIVSKYKSLPEKVTSFEVPALINGLKVTKIGYQAFSNVNIDYLKLPQTIKDIESYALSFNTNGIMKYITIPASVERLEYLWNNNLKILYFFEGFRVKDVAPNRQCKLEIKMEWMRDFGKTVNNSLGIGLQWDYIFQNEWHLNEVHDPIPNNPNDIYEFNDIIQSIGLSKKYRYLSGELELPKYYLGKKVLGTDSFYNCNLSTIIIPEGVENIYGYFSLSEYLSKVVLPSTIKTLILSSFARCPNLKTLILPEGLSYLNISKYFNPSPSTYNFTGIIIPTTVESLYIDYGNYFPLFTELSEPKMNWNLENSPKIYYLGEWYYSSENLPIPKVN
jgi:hypothetical protein